MTTSLAFNLPLLWALVLSFVVIMYVILDGFDLGIGILFPFVTTEAQRAVMMQTVLPVWDGNETWLVLGGACLYGAFPQAYSTLLPTLYMPICIMLAALVFRGVAFEFRHRAGAKPWFWNTAFSMGSIIAAFCQGLILGTFVIGYQTYIPGQLFHWLTPFSVMTGIAVVAGYGLLGATWLINKTEAELQALMYRFAQRLLIGVAVFMLLVSVATPLFVPEIWQRWFAENHFLYLLPLPLTTAVVFLMTWIMLKEKREPWPFYLSISLFILAYIGFCISDFPYIIPRQVTIWQAAAPVTSLKFFLVGVISLLPILLIYTAYSYRIFRGKITDVQHHY